MTVDAAATPPSVRPPPRILAIAYTCVPGAGSEPGVGWTWARILAGIGDVVVLTRPIRGFPVDLAGAAREMPEGDRIRFVEIDLPAWFTRVVDGGNARAPRLQRLQYLAWLIIALRAARRLHRRSRFDLVWHLTFANAWLGSFGPWVGPPFVFGPVGGGVTPPWRIVPSLGVRGAAFEIVRVIVRELSVHLNPLARRSVRHSDLILTQNEDTQRWLPREGGRHAVVFPNAVLEVTPEERRPRSGPPTALFVGRLISWKGVHLAIRAIARLPEWRLLIAGDGREESALRRLAVDLGLADRVQFLGWLERDEVFRLMSEEADALIFPSLHDEAGMVVAEARAIGLPVVCLDRGGPPSLGGHGVEPAGLETTVDRLASAVEEVRRQPPEPSDVRDIPAARTALVRILRTAGLPAGEVAARERPVVEAHRDPG